MENHQLLLVLKEEGKSDVYIRNYAVTAIAGLVAEAAEAAAADALQGNAVEVEAAAEGVVTVQPDLGFLNNVKAWGKALDCADKAVGWGAEKVLAMQYLHQALSQLMKEVEEGTLVCERLLLILFAHSYLSWFW